ncbi:MAG: DUF469 family protein [Pseudomonadales bacterium]|nr:DUF469 family protein [Pseudomonadales bacterium]
MDDLIVFIEARGLLMGGFGNPSELWHESLICAAGRGSASDEDRFAVRKWLSGHPAVEEVQTGALVDAPVWLGNGGLTHRQDKAPVWLERSRSIPCPPAAAVLESGRSSGSSAFTAFTTCLSRQSTLPHPEIPQRIAPRPTSAQHQPLPIASVPAPNPRASRRRHSRHHRRPCRQRATRGLDLCASPAREPASARSALGPRCWQ